MAGRLNWGESERGEFGDEACGDTGLWSLKKKAKLPATNIHGIYSAIIIKPCACLGCIPPPVRAKGCKDNRQIIIFADTLRPVS